MTADELEAHLRRCGYDVETITGDDTVSYTVVRQVRLPSGPLRGRVCDIAIARDQSVPYVAPAAIHTRPALVPMSSGAPLGTQASGIGAEWQYWSRRFDRPPTPQGLWAHVMSVLCDDVLPAA